MTYAKGFYKSNTWTTLNILLIDRSARFSGSLGSSGFTIHFVSRFVTMSSSKKRKISSKTQKLKPCGNENLERALYTWFVQMRQQGVPVSGPVLREKALSYAKEMDIKDFIASNGWFDRWKSRHGVAFKAIAGEAQSCTLEITAS